MFLKRIKMNYKIFLFYLFICIACNTKLFSNDYYVSNDKDTNQAIIRKKSHILYLCANDTLRQIVELERKSKGKIFIKLTSENIKRNITASIEGFAKLKEGDNDIEDLDSENAYPVDTYIYTNKNGCWLSIEIDSETHTKMILYESKCIESNKYCPFSSIGVLKKQK